MIDYLDGFTPYKKDDAEKYDRLRWWSGLTFGDLLDKAADLYPEKEALVEVIEAMPYTKAEKVDKKHLMEDIKERLRTVP